MTAFDHFPEERECPFCRTNEDKKTCLIPIDGTDSGNNCEAIAVHVDCIQDFSNFRYIQEHRIFYSKV